MAKIKCFHCHRTLPLEEVISHASAKHPSEDLAILLHDGQNHFIPKVYNWKPIISVGTEVYLEEGTYKLIRRSDQDQPKWQKISVATPEKKSKLATKRNLSDNTDQATTPPEAEEDHVS